MSTHDDAIDVDSSFEVGDTIPSKLYAKVETFYPQIRQALVEKKVAGTFKALKKRLRFGPNGPNDDVETICFRLAAIASEDARASQRDTVYRAVLLIPHPERSNGFLRKQAPLRAVIDEEGNVELFDSQDFQERDNFEFYKELLDDQREKNDQLFQRSLDLLDKNIELADKMGDQAVDYAKATNEIASGLSDVSKAAVNAMKGAAEIVRPHQEQTTAVQLAKLDQEGEAAKLKIVMMLVSKFGGPLMKQITNAIAGKPKNTRIPELEAAEAEAQAEAQAEESATVTVDDDAPIHKRLTSWLGKLGEARIAKLKEIVGAHAEAFTKATNDNEAQAALDGLNADFKAMSDKDGGAEELGTKLTQLGELLGDELTHEFVSMLPD